MLGLRRRTRSRRAQDGPPSEADRERVHGYLRRFGTNPNSFLIRYAGDWRYFFGTSVDGVVCYVRIDRTAVAWGDPLCAPDDAHALLREFLDSMRDRGLRTALLVLQEEPARVAMALGCSALNIGAEPSFDLATWRVPRGDRGKKLRWCLNHGRRAGVRIEEYRMVAAGRDPNLERRMQEVQRRWEAGLGRSVIRSFLGSNPMAEFESKRIFLAWRGDRLEAFLACSPVHGRDGWYLEDLVRLPDATNGATELLVVTAMERLRDGGSRFATLGIAPLHGSDEQMDRRARWLVPALRAAFEHFDRRYRFATLSRYKAKFGPSWWERRYAAFSPPRPSIGTVRAVMAVLDPSPEPEPFRERPAAQRLVLVQVLLWLAASALVLTPDHLAGRFEPSAGFLAPVGAAGLAVAALLYVAASRLARAGDSAARFVLVGLEAVLVIGAVVRIRDGRWAPMEVVIAAVAAVVAVLLVTGRPAGTEDGREPARGETIG